MRLSIEKKTCDEIVDLMMKTSDRTELSAIKTALRANKGAVNIETVRTRMQILALLADENKYEMIAQKLRTRMSILTTETDIKSLENLVQIGPVEPKQTLTENEADDETVRRLEAALKF
ncbi:hypothetical protein GW756_03400 [bacterium]|nr:hypothetical protein [bacterium]NCQ55436.1 hypothetical protein [Candidatus Parcubacteria bacterium]NCS67798.1 hypothetical protein [Candidatus Peregrinibacteria bacterium]NCS96388.1 hypothetical protein [bacterium]